MVDFEKGRLLVYVLMHLKVCVCVCERVWGRERDVLASPSLLTALWERKYGNKERRKKGSLVGWLSSAREEPQNSRLCLLLELSASERKSEDKQQRQVSQMSWTNMCVFYCWKGNAFALLIVYLTFCFSRLDKKKILWKNGFEIKACECMANQSTVFKWTKPHLIYLH